MQDDDFQKHEAKQAEKRSEVDLEITNDARRGDFDTGRRTNRGLKEAHERKIRAKKQSDSQLSQALKMNAEYSKLYNVVMDKLDNAMPIVYNALEESNEKLAELENKASTLPDGTRVYKNSKDEAITQNGLMLSAAEIASVNWRDDAPSWEEYQGAKGRRDQLEQGFDRLGEIKEIMEDDSLEKTSEIMEGFEREIETITDQAMMANKNDHDMEVKVTTPDNLPELGL